MISFLFKFSLTFVFCFVIMSFQVNNKTIFSHLSEITGPIGSDVQSSLQKSVKRSYKKSKEIGEEFFSNSDPKYIDSINSKRSSTKVKNGHGMVLEQIQQDDMQELDEVIKKN